MNQFVSFVALFLSLVSQILCTSTTPANSSEENSKQVEQQTNELMRNDKMRDVYIKCLLDKGPCTGEAADVKSKFGCIFFPY